MVAANIYFIHSFFISFLYFIAVLIFYFAFGQNYLLAGQLEDIDPALVGDYMLIRMPIACLLNLFNYSCMAFF